MKNLNPDFYQKANIGGYSLLQLTQIQIHRSVFETKMNEVVSNLIYWMQFYLYFLVFAFVFTSQKPSKSNALHLKHNEYQFFCNKN